MRGLLIGFAGTALAVGLAFPALAEPEVVVLGGPTDADPVAACGDLAASPFEVDRDGRGVIDKHLLINAAITACEAAVAADPDLASAKTWLARAYLAAGRMDDARPLLEDAFNAGNPFAAYLLSDVVNLQGKPDETFNSLDLLINASDAGFAPAQADLALMYETGRGIDANPSEALRLYELASAQGHGLASYKVGEFYWRANGVAFDSARAKEAYALAAQQGEPLGNTGLGQVAQYGEAPDYGAAAGFYQLAADKREKIAETELAYLYDQGLGVPQDLAKGFDLLTDASNQGWPWAKAALSLYYLFGKTVAVDEAKAFELANDALWGEVTGTGPSVPYAYGILGYMYKEGLGAPRSLPQALYNYQSGADRGDQFSIDQLAVVQTLLACSDAAAAPYETTPETKVAFGDLDPDVAIPACEQAVAVDPHVGNKAWLARAYVKAERYGEAIPLLEEGLASGNRVANFVLADLLMNGEGMEADPERAFAMYQAMVQDDFGIAQLELGKAYAKGRGVEQNLDEALRWFKLAQANGIEDAAAEIEALGLEPVTEVDLSGFGREGPGY